MLRKSRPSEAPEPNPLLEVAKRIRETSPNEPLITSENAAAYLQLDEVGRYLGDEFIAVLGNSVDYAIGYHAVDPSGAGHSHREVNVTGKSEFDSASLMGRAHSNPRLTA